MKSRKKLLEERLFKRFQVPVTVNYGVPNGINGKAIAKDISLGGLCFQLPQRIDIERKTKLWLEIKMPESNRSTIGIGEVIWEKKIDSDVVHNHEAGIKFTQIDSFDLENIITKLRLKTFPFHPNLYR